MAPNRGSSKSSRGGRGGSRGASRGAKDAGSRHGATSRSRVEKKTKLPPPKQQKTKSAAGKLKHGSEKKKPRVYTDKELGIPKLNMTTPVGVAEPRGKKRGKIFVDDAESMKTILAIVTADQEGQIESKMLKVRRMEEIRELRKAETEKREQMKKGKLEEKKESLKRRKQPNNVKAADTVTAEPTKPFKPRKRVSFG